MDRAPVILLAVGRGIIGEGDQVPFSARGILAEYKRNTGRGTEWHKCPWPINVEEEQESLSQQLSPGPHLSFSSFGLTASLFIASQCPTTSANPLSQGMVLFPAQESEGQRGNVLGFRAQGAFVHLPLKLMTDVITDKKETVRTKAFPLVPWKGSISLRTSKRHHSVITDPPHPELGDS